MSIQCFICIPIILMNMIGFSIFDQGIQVFKQIKKTSQNVAFAMKHLYKAAPFLFIIIFFLTITITIGDFFTTCFTQ